MTSRLRSRRNFGKLDRDGFIHRSWIQGTGLPEHVFDGRPMRARARALAVYSLSTAFIDAATAEIIVPRSVTFVGTVLMTILVYGPAHLIVAFLLECRAAPKIDMS